MDELQGGEIQIEDAVLAGGFIQIPAIILFDANLSSGAKITYGALLWYAWKYRRCPEQKIMCAEIGVSLRTIQGHIAELERMNYIEVLQLGLGRPNAYVIKSLQSRGNGIQSNYHSEPQKIAVTETQQITLCNRRKLRLQAAENCGSYNKDVIQEQLIQQQEPLRSEQIAHSVSITEENVVVSDSHPTSNNILIRLLNLGVARSTAKSLLKQHDTLNVYRWLAYTEHKLTTGWLPRESPAAWLVQAIRSGDWVIPNWFQTPEEQGAIIATQEKLAADEQQHRQQQTEQAQQKAENQRRAIERELGIGEKTRDLWEQVKILLLERNEFSIAFHTAFLLPLNGRIATITTPVQFFCGILEKHTNNLCNAIEEVSGKSIERIEIKLVASQVEESDE